MRHHLIFVLILSSFACAKPEPAAPPEPPPHTQTPPEIAASNQPETENLLNAGYGAAVVSRTGELTLENSAIRAIDGDADTLWASPPEDFQQTLVFSFPAPVRIDKVGARTPVAARTRTKSMVVETSSDGRSFQQIASLQLAQSQDAQLFDASSPSARYLRITTKEGGERLVALQTVHVRGSWLSPPSVSPIEGCWTINGLEASFASSGGRVSGNVGDFQIDGGVEGAAYRFVWSRRAEWGYAFVTMTPDGNRLSGMVWHEEAAAHSYGTSWFGERRACQPAPADGNQVFRTFLARAGWYPLFSLHFDSKDAVIASTSEGALKIIGLALERVRTERIIIVAREYHEASPAANQRRAEARLQSLRNTLAQRGVDVSRINFAPLGSDSPRRPTATEPMRLLYGVVEIEVSPAARSAF